MNTPPKPIRPGMRIPWPDDGKNNCLSKQYTAYIVAVCNAVLNTKLPDGGKFLISDKDLTLDFSEMLADIGSSSSTATTFPWQITLQDTPDGRTFRVGSGFALPVTHPGMNYSSLNYFSSAGHGVDITVPADESMLVWARCQSAPDWVAEIQTGDEFDLPADWFNYPAIQGGDIWWPTKNTYPYFLIGIVDATVSPTGITQLLTHNPQIPIAGREEVVFQDTWDSGGAYRLFAIVKHSGASYIRTNLAGGGDSGGTPGSSSDWTAL